MDVCGVCERVCVYTFVLDFFFSSFVGWIVCAIPSLSNCDENFAPWAKGLAVPVFSIN